VSPSFAQTNLDTLKIDALLRGIYTVNESAQSVDAKIIQTIQAIDKNINSIVQAKTTWTPKKFTVIGSNNISIRQLVDKKEAIRIILSDTTQKINYQSYWEQTGQDTTKFLSGMLTQSDFDLHYPNYQYPKVVTTVKPLTIQSQLRCQNVLFYSKQLDLTIDSLSKTINKKLRQSYYEYLTSSIDHFWSDKKKVEPKAIRILTITFGTDNLVYSGVDIYGTHYLLAFDTSKSWQLESIKTLWTY
jgi:hypothetical protein